MRLSEPINWAELPECVEDGCGQPQKVVARRSRNAGLTHYSVKYCDEHYREMASETNPRRRPDRYTDSSGYVWLRQPDGSRIAEHRLVMQEILGRELRSGESVHHKNGVRDDNRPENLELWVKSPRYGQRASDLICPHCDQPYWPATS